MSAPLKLVSRPRNYLNDPRSTGAVSRVRVADIPALRGTKLSEPLR